ncbi:MAG: hypothetical protein REI12_07280, partial [Pedobacter sp.]|nr:hypothetical protein [Pedobacter sp.]
GTVWASGDGGTILLPQNGLSPDPELAAYNTSTGIGYLTPVRINMSTISMSRDGSVVMFDSGNVYDRYFGLLGNIGWSLRFLVSPDGTRAYAYIMNSYTGDPEGVDVYDLTTPVGSGFKKLTRLPLSPTILAPGAYGVALGISPDGKTLFVWATAKMVAIPL